MKRSMFIGLLVMAFAIAPCFAADNDFTIGIWGMRSYILNPNNPGDWAKMRANAINLGANDIEACLVPYDTLWLNKICDDSLKNAMHTEPFGVTPLWALLQGSWKDNLPLDWQAQVRQRLDNVAQQFSPRAGWGGLRMGHESYSSWTAANWQNIMEVIDYACLYWRSLDIPDNKKDKLFYIMPVETFGPDCAITMDEFVSNMPNLGIMLHDRYPFTPELPDTYSLNSDSFLVFQQRMDNVVYLNDQCYEHYENPSKKSANVQTKWYAILQGLYMRKMDYTPALRWPTREEVRLQAWLALSRGAKGIKYFTSITGDDGCFRFWGILDEDDNPRSKTTLRWQGDEYDDDPYGRFYDWVKELNDTLQVVGPILKNTNCEKAFGVNKVNGVIPADCYVKNVTALDPQYGQYNYFEAATFKDISLEHYGEQYFMVVNRYCQPQDTVQVSVKLNYTPLYTGMNYFVVDAISNETVSPLLPRSTDTSFTITLLPGGGRLLKIIPFTSTPKVQGGAPYTNFRFVSLSPNIASTLSNDSIQITQKYYTIVQPDTQTTAKFAFGYWKSIISGWLPYNVSSIQYLQKSEENKQNIFELQYKIDGGKITTPKFSTKIYINDVKPATGGITINNGDQYTNDTLINLKISGSDAFPGLSQMRFAEKPFGNNSGYLNFVKNAMFDDTTNWVLDNAEFYDGFLHLKGIHTGPGPAQIGALAKQIIPGSEINQHRNKLLRLTDDIYAHDVISSYKVVEVFYSDAVYPNSVRLLEKTIASDPEVIWKTKSDTFTLTVDTTRTIDRMEISYNIYGIEVPPPPPDDDPLFNTIVVDNIRLERVELRGGTPPPPPPPPPDEYVKPYIYDGWLSADTSMYYNYTLSAGDGIKRVYLQLNDLPGNISSEPGWYDDIILDMTLPNSNITLPLTASYINGTVNSYGFSSDLNFDKWILDYKPYSYGDWHELIRSGVNQIDFNPGDLLYTWNTGTLHEGTYLLRLSTYDKASNVKADTHFVYVIIEPALPISAVTAEFATFNSLPVDATCDNLGNIYVTDTQADKIWKFSPEGDSLLCFGYKYTGQDTLGLNHPKGIAVDDSGNIWITDCYQSKVKKYDSFGNYLSAIGKHGNQQGEFNQPTGIAISVNEIYVVDHLNGRVQVFNKTGAFIRQFGNNCLNQPAGIAIRNNETEKLVYVCDSQNDRIAIFDSAGYMVNTLDSLGLDKPWDICFDNNNNLYIADVYNNRVIELDPWHNKLLTFGIQGQEAGQFKLPQGLAVSPDGKHLYVADTHNDRLQRFKMFFDMGTLGGAQFAGKRQIANSAPTVFGLSQCYPNPCKQKTSINYQIPKAGNVSLKVYNTLGQVVKILVNENQQPGYYSINWDGRDESNRQAATGIYFYRIASGEFNSTKKMVVLR